MADALAGGLDTRFKLTAKLSTGVRSSSASMYGRVCLRPVLYEAMPACMS